VTPVARLDVVVEAAHVLAALGLVDAFGHVSARDGDGLLITPPAALDQAAAADLVPVPIAAWRAAAPPFRARLWRHRARGVG
jgi:HCOMODA/2-hydroxy-3-carboxy-muconic semialdehyde decarboxylase